MKRLRRLFGPGLGVVGAIAIGKLLLHLATASRYGYFGDELYFMACGEHIDWGYVDQPPLIAVVAWLVRHILGTSLLAMRLPSALAGVALVLLTALLARELGGGRFAMALAALSSALAPTYVVMHYLFTMNAFEPLFWTGCALVVVRLVKTGDQRLWLLFGALAGIGLENKYSMAVYAGALVAGVLLSPERRAFARPWIWLGGLVALLLFLPNLVWNVQHHWPFLELMRNIRASGRDVVVSPIGFVLRQGLDMGPTAVPVWLAGLGWLLFAKGGRAYRPLGIAFVLTLLTFIVTHGKEYYLAPAFATVFAAGGVAIEGFTAEGRRSLLRPVLVVSLLSILAFLPLVLPILRVDRFLAYQQWIGFTPPATEKAHARAALPHHFAWQFGWEEMVAAVSQAYWNLPPEERARAVVIGNNYGESGAVDLLGPKYGLPLRALGTHQSYWLWGPGDPSKDVAIVLGDRVESLSRLCGEVQVVAELSHPYTAVWENKPVLICRQPRVRLADIWPKIKNWD
jgi:4-amino-4-deoxy-L-arabinose transferase-like glycosyltransferase